MTLVNPFNLSHVPYKNKAMLPASPGIYYVLNLSNSEIIYIGQSKNIRSRWNGYHHRDWDIGMFQAVYETIRIVIAWELFAKEKLNELERDRIRECKPILNGKNADNTEIVLFGKDDLQNSPQYFRYLTNNIVQEVIDTISTQELNYLKRKADLLELFNYRHPSTKQLIPRYKFFEEDCLMLYSVNADKDPLYAKYANEIHELMNDDLRAAMNYFIYTVEHPWRFKTLGWSEEKVVEALTFLFGHFVEAGIKAIDSIIPVQDFHGTFLKQVKDGSVEASFLSILRPIYRKVAKRNWWMIHATAVVDLDGRLHDPSTPDAPPEK